jgi:hypothetical protein
MSEGQVTSQRALLCNKDGAIVFSLSPSTPSNPHPSLVVTNHRQVALCQFHRHVNMLGLYLSALCHYNEMSLVGLT